MADKDNTPDTPVQHTPKHLVDGDVFDPRHPAAKSYAVMQPAAGVVADDVEEKGQNLRGGPTASEANRANMDQREKLVENYERDLREKSGVGAVNTDVNVEDGVAKASRSTDPRSSSSSTARGETAKADAKADEAK